MRSLHLLFSFPFLYLTVNHLASLLRFLLSSPPFSSDLAPSSPRHRSSTPRNGLRALLPRRRLPPRPRTGAVLRLIRSSGWHRPRRDGALRDDAAVVGLVRAAAPRGLHRRGALPLRAQLPRLIPCPRRGGRRRRGHQRPHRPARHHLQHGRECQQLLLQHAAQLVAQPRGRQAVPRRQQHVAQLQRRAEAQGCLRRAGQVGRGHQWELEVVQGRRRRRGGGRGGGEAGAGQGLHPCAGAAGPGHR
jgi:hypothetical protein